MKTGSLWRSALIALTATTLVWAGDIVVQTSSGGGDLVDWSQLGPDLTPVPQNFSATSTSGIGISGSFAGGPGGSGGGTTAVVCPAGVCSWTTSGTGFSAGDTVLVSTDGETANGPLTLAFSTGIAQVGAYMQADFPGTFDQVDNTFTGQIEVFDGATSLATFTATSDADGDPVFLGAFDQTGANITSLVFSMTQSFQSDLNDFAIDELQVAPEPGSLTLMALAALVFLAWRFRRRFAISAIVLCAFGVVAFAQFGGPGNPFSGAGTGDTGPYPLVGATPSTTTIPMALPGNQSASQVNGGLAANVSNVPLWSYGIVSTRDGNTYTGLMVGRSPSNRLATTTTIPVKVIPVAWQFVTNNGNTVTTFDPTLPDPCSPRNPATDTALGNTMASPLFQANNTYNYGGTVVGANTQFHDAWRRANFWSYVSRTGNSYHTVMTPTVLPKWTVVATQNFWIGSTTGISGNCTGNTIPVGVINLAAWDSYVTGTLIPAYQALGVGTNTLAFFVFYNVYLQSPFTGPTGGCCVLGYHSAYSAGLNLAQTYGTSVYDSSGAFAASGAFDVSVMTHELGEWMDDPIGNNATPSWGHIGQVTGCQANLEVGDPLSGTNMPNITSNGFTYHMQELSFFSWFFGAPSLGVNNWFSSNGTFRTDAGGVCH